MKAEKIGRALLSLALLVAQAGAAQKPADSVDALARDVDRLESLRAVKDLQRHYAQYGQYGLWDAMAVLTPVDAPEAPSKITR